MAAAVFLGPHGTNPTAAIRATIAAITVTQGDLLNVGEAFRSLIRQRTQQGVDVNGAPFAAYSTRGPYYLYPNKSAGSTRAASGTRFFTQTQVRAARATAAKGRLAKTGGGIRTPYGIRYPSYAAAKAAHGVSGVNLFGMEQHTHMLDTMMVRVNGVELSGGTNLPGFGSEFEASEGITPARTLSLGFYGPEADRAKGNNEGTAKLPKRFFLGLNAEDLLIGEQIIVRRAESRAKHSG